MIVYLVVGIVVSKFALHKEGSEIIPNKSFWKDLPFLVKVSLEFLDITQSYTLVVKVYPVARKSFPNLLL